jgi:hypothetical protein
LDDLRSLEYRFEDVSLKGKANVFEDGLDLCLWTRDIEVFLPHSVARELLREKQFDSSSLIGVVLSRNGGYIGVCDTLHFGFGDVVADGGDPEQPVFVALLGDVPKPEFVGPAQVIVRPDLVVIGLASDALAGVPLVAGDPHSEDVLRRELFLAEVGGQAKLVLLPVDEVVQVALHEDGALDAVAVRLGVQHLLDLVVHRVLLDLAEAEVGGVHRPVVGPLLLLARIVVLV